MPTIDNDVAQNDDDAFDAEGAFGKLWGTEDDASKKKKPSDDEDQAKDDKEDEGSEETDETEGDEGDEQSTDETDETEGDEEKEGDEDNDANVVVKDDYKVKIKVGDEEQEFTIGALKRLAGQEASLTQKSQEVATKRKTLDAQAATQVAVLDRLRDAAMKKFEPYKNLNFLALSRDPNISTEELTALQDAANAAASDVRFIEQELGAFQQQLQKQRADDLKTQAAETVKVLSDPEKGIPGWSEKVYGDIMGYAKSQGVTEDALNEIVDPISLRILHKAMLYDAGLKTVKSETDPNSKKSKDKAKTKHPKRIVKGFNNSDTTKEVLKGDKSKEAMKRLAQSGSEKDAADAFMARFGG